MKRRYFILFLVGFCFAGQPFLRAEEKVLAEGAPLVPTLGLYLERPNGGFLNVRIVNNNFELYFLDAEKKLLKPDYNYAILSYASKVKKSDRKQTLKVSIAPNGLFMTAKRAISPPHDYELRLFLKDKVVDPATVPQYPDYGAKNEPEVERYGLNRVNQLKKEKTEESDS